jgi:small subunit ribosomal protein S6
VPKNQLGDILKRTGTRVLDAGGVITDITSYGTRSLAYEFKSPNEKHFEAHTVQISFNVTPSVLDELKHDMRTDERVLRWIAVKEKALKPLKNYPARDPRNPLNLSAMTKE